MDFFVPTWASQIPRLAGTNAAAKEVTPEQGRDRPEPLAVAPDAAAPRKPGWPKGRARKAKN